MKMIEDYTNINLEEHQLYDHGMLRNELINEKNESRVTYLRRLSIVGPSREYRRPKATAQMDDLYESFPNFSETLDRLSEQTALSALAANSVFTIRPILLVGPPGVGKTRFVREIAKRLGLEFTNINCGGITAGWILSGSSISWSDGRPGMVHNAMRDGKTANPIIMLDEIDKLSGDSRFSGFGPLYQLLDKDSAKTFTDEAVGIPIDCSAVTWIATANETDSIPEAIVSRFTVIEVEAPTADQMVNVIKSIYADILEDNKSSWGVYFEPEINDDMIDCLEAQAPREIVKMILTAIGRAARSRGALVTVDSPLIRITAADFKDFKKPKMKMGF
jgi:ATP-dependent Lon protease